MCFDVGWAALEQDRRQLERDIFSGKLSGIAATNAPELGIDVGHIDAALHLGFPGSVASSWQQAGRSGRRERPSLAVYVSFEEPLDQYFMKFPKTLPCLGNALMSLKNKGDLSFDPSRDSSARIWSYIGHEIYEGAVYMHQGKTNMVKELDISEKIALCYEANLHYYTKTRDHTDIDVLGAIVGNAKRRNMWDRLLSIMSLGMSSIIAIAAMLTRNIAIFS
ncbi:hypothetical protein D5086_023252 [Populus alba]|uniref:Uncharacterized protein n=1 Tax=Populus alba TaxID=43335 RepID=A0ACC4BA67_POPAL